MITENTVLVTAKLIEARNAMRSLHGDTWQEKIDLMAPVIRAKATSEGIAILAAALQLATQAKKDGKPSIGVMFLAVGAELTDASDPLTKPSPPSD